MIVYMSLIDSVEEQSKFEILYKQHRSLMFYVARRILGSDADAEDAVHDAFVRIAENMGRIDEPSGVKAQAYVVTIAENRAIDLYRKKHRHESVPLENYTGISVDMQDTTGLTLCLQKLSLQQRSVLLLKYLYGFSAREIGNLLDLTQANVIKIDQRAKKKLQQLCQEEGIAV